MTNYLFHAYYINLDHRIDRNESILKQLHQISDNKLEITRIPGIYTPHLGTLGCSQSHIAALIKIIESDTEDDSLHIIFEDDFEFSLPSDDLDNVLAKIHDMMKQNKDMHVFCLSANILESTNIENNVLGTPFSLHRILKSQAHSGYIVKKLFAPILLKNYQESESMIIQCNCSNHPYCMDIYVQHLQPVWGWYSFLPKIGRQTPGYSDIQQTHADHQC